MRRSSLVGYLLSFFGCEQNIGMFLFVQGVAADEQYARQEKGHCDGAGKNR